MQIERFSWTAERGFEPKQLPALDGDGTMVLVFGSPKLAQLASPLTMVSAAYPNSAVLGCSTSGQFLGEDLTYDGLSGVVCQFEENTQTRLAWASVIGSEGSYWVGQALGVQLAAADLVGVLLLSDGLLVNGSELVRGLTATVADGVQISGGLAGDGSDFERTWVLAGHQVASGLVAAVGLYGANVRLGHGSEGGWDKFGPERLITRSEGNVLYEVDGKPALALYKEYLGDYASGLPATALLFPLSIRPAGSTGHSLVRTVLSVDEAAQSMTFAGDVPEGHVARLMRSSLDDLIDGAVDAATAADEKGRPTSLALAVSCVGRRLVLGERTEEELEAVTGVLGKNTSLVGFYSYGEVSPVAGVCDLHNQTMTVTTMWEEPASP
jgi:hypothetical protein